jgi:hypothetical protein
VERGKEQGIVNWTVPSAEPFFLCDLADAGDERREEIENIRKSAYQRKQVLNRDVKIFKGELHLMENALSRTCSLAE